jgi:hypothetical protein
MEGLGILSLRSPKEVRLRKIDGILQSSIAAKYRGPSIAESVKMIIDYRR